MGGCSWIGATAQGKRRERFTWWRRISAMVLVRRFNRSLLSLRRRRKMLRRAVSGRPASPLPGPENSRFLSMIQLLSSRVRGGCTFGRNQGKKLVNEGVEKHPFFVVES